jgi:hypothetical protein
MDTESTKRRAIAQWVGLKVTEKTSSNPQERTNARRVAYVIAAKHNLDTDALEPQVAAEIDQMEEDQR